MGESVATASGVVPVMGRGAELSAVRPPSGAGVCGAAEPVAVRR
ncbi:hypothetical protein ABZ642_10605 [Streptomyces sp. NPDC007157]